MNDPVKSCKVYLTEGCSHVDGLLCHFPRCSILEQYEQTQHPDDQIIDKIIVLIDKSTLLGAAYDCISERGKTAFKSNLKNILQERP